MDKEKIILAGKIASQVKEWIKPQIKKDVPLLEIAEKIEAKIIELGGKPAFPVNLSINEIAAHYTPSYDDKTEAHGLLKVDFGVHIDGWISDTAFSVDLENSEENKNLIKASEKALKAGQEKIRNNIDSGEIGEEIEKAIESEGFIPIMNLSGHQIDRYDLHSGISIPNIKTRGDIIEEGIYAIEPFATLKTGSGKVYDAGSSGIYFMQSPKNVRNPIAREVLDFVFEEYQTLPFCSRWIVKKFGTRGLIGLKYLEQNGNLHHFSQLIESSKQKVSQAENTVLISDKEKIITTI